MSVYFFFWGNYYNIFNVKLDMKRIGYLFAALLLPLFVFVSCGGDKEKEENNPEPSPSPTPNPEQEEVITDIDFAYGCDPSWVTPMEAAGVKFYTCT